jgi:hypothetical protein
MRISLLEKREDFYKILKITLNSYIENSNINNTKFSFYVVNKYLNFIANIYLPSSLFNILKNEYSNSNVNWKIIFQFLYVQLAVKKGLRLFFAQKVIRLPNYFSEFLILGGNHRLRLFSKTLNGSLVILKSKEREKYICNDIKIRESFCLSFAPIILDKGKDWFIEEYFEGKPVNRLKKENDYNLDLLFEFYQKELLDPSKEVLTIIDYKNLINLDLKTILKVNFESNLKNDLDKLIVETFKSLFSLINTERVEVSWTHGDLQEANILINKEKIKVIDWESADKRFYLYDYFTFFSKIRSNISLNKSISNFSAKFKNDMNFIYLLLIEELRFSLNEEFSLNFFSSGQKTKKLCVDILNYINE